MSELATYKTFSTIQQAQEYIHLLEENNLPYLLEDSSHGTPVAIVGHGVSFAINLKIYLRDFELLNQLASEQAAYMADHIEPDYYLFSFSEEELFAIIRQPDAWSPLDYELATRILNEKGIPITKEVEQIAFDQRMQELTEPEKAGTIWIALGYLFALLGGLMGIFIGIVLWRYSKALPNGQRIYVYNSRTRLHGFIITITGVLVFIAFALASRNNGVFGPFELF